MADGDGSWHGSGGSRARIESLCSSAVVGAAVDGCGLSVMAGSGTPVTVHATDAVAAKVEDLQFMLGEGPCRDAALAGSPVLISDIRDRREGVAERWPMFLEEVDRVGVRAVFAFPVRIGAIALGVMDLYRSRPGPLARQELASTFSHVDALGQQLLDLDGIPPDEPEQAYPLTVHQAAGMVMVQLGSTIDVALVRLRATAYAESRPIADLAADVVAGRFRFSPM